MFEAEINIKNILNKNLKKDYQILVPYKLIEQRINKIVADIQKNYKMKGFRPGQVPANIIKDKYENSLMAEESEKIINETSRKIVSENNLKLALSPKVEIKVFEPKKDFEYKLTIELFPTVPEIDLAKIKLVKRKVEIGKNEIDEAVKKLFSHYKKWEKQPDSYAAKIGDAVNIDYVGKIDKKEFDGGSAKEYQLELGSKSFIDDFEEQLVGVKAGKEVRVKVKFPKEYHNQEFSGKAAEFDVKVNSVLTSLPIDKSDEFVKNNFGVENFSKIEEILQTQLENDYETMAKNLFKKDLFDFLNKKFDFDLPEGLVEEQFGKMWAGIERELERDPQKFKNDKEKEKAKNEQRKLAEKLTRNGIILSEITKNNNITVAKNELLEEVNKKISQFPGQEKMVMEYYQKNPEAIQELNGIILEEKVINFILEKANIDHKKLTTKELEKELEKSSD